MMNIVILAVGKIKKEYFKEAADEYQKRLRPYAKISVEEIQTEPFKRNSDKEKSKRVEGERLLKFLRKYSDDEIVALDERGREFSSRDFSEFLGDTGRRVVFVIGGALGLDKEIIGVSYRKMSLSRMTMPHELARVILLEQIYRAATIITNKEYHY